ncbi:MAG: hypothetical protein H5U00_07485 [Clostridia bacterium]|nr:hypothetical protein [Clostridia bacterium]
MEVCLEAGEISLTFTLNQTATAGKIWEALPFEARANTWGEEIYFSIPVEAGDEAPQELVAAGDVAYWPPGRALCLFYGPTPVSAPGEIRPYSPVTVVGKVLGDPKVLQAIGDGMRVRLRRASG